MPNIVVNDIPADLYERFQEIAQQDGRSFNAEVIVAMEAYLQQTVRLPERKAALERINELRRQRPRITVDIVEMRYRKIDR